MKHVLVISVNIIRIFPPTTTTTPPPPFSLSQQTGDLVSGTSGCICWRCGRAHLLATCLSPPWSCIRSASRAAELWSAGLWRKTNGSISSPCERSYQSGLRCRLSFSADQKLGWGASLRFCPQMLLLLPKIQSRSYSWSSVYEFLSTKSSTSDAQWCGHHWDPSSARPLSSPFHVAGEMRVFIFRSSGGPHDPVQHRTHRKLTLWRSRAIHSHPLRRLQNTSAERVAASTRPRSPQVVRLSQTICPRWRSTVQRDSRGDKRGGVGVSDVSLLVLPLGSLIVHRLHPLAN